MHGGSAPQVRDAAQRRLLAAVDPAIDRLLDLLDSPDHRVQLQAARLILDRAGIVPTTEAGFPSPAQIEGWIAELEADLALGDDA